MKGLTKDVRSIMMKRLTSFLLVIFSCTLIASVVLYFLANSNSTKHVRTTYESSIWSSLQLQVQSYRFVDYLKRLDKDNPPAAGDVLFYYDLLMSRIDLLKVGSVGNRIHYYGDGRSIRILNFISAELELLQPNIVQIENNDLSNLDKLINKLHLLEPQINKFVSLVNQSSRAYSVEQREQILEEFQLFKYIMLIFIINAIALFLVLMTNIRSTRIAVMKAKEAEHQIENIAQDKTHFLATMSHEINTPLDRVINMSKLLRTKGLNNEQCQILDTIEDSGTLLLNLIKDFSDLSDIASDNLVLDYAPFSLAHELEKSIKFAAMRSNPKAVRVLSYIDLTLPDQAIYDNSRLHQIIYNLIDNSFKFTPSGHISIVVRMSQTKAPQWRPSLYPEIPASMIQVVIKDTGIGISDSILEMLQSPLDSQVPNFPENKYCLGLYLCRALAHLMHGELSCHSPESGGSEFILELPIFHHQITPIQEGKAAQALIKSLTNKNMIILEASDSVAHLMAMQANALGLNTPLHTQMLNQIPEQKIHYIYIGDDSMLDDLSYINLQKLVNTGSQLVADSNLSQNRTKALAHALYKGPLLHLNMGHALNELAHQDFISSQAY